MRSEQEAFRWFLVIGAGAATVIALATLIRPAVGAFWGLFLILAGAVWLWRDSRGTEREQFTITGGRDGRYRVLVMANQTVRSPDLIAEVVRITEGRDAEVLLVVPAVVPGRAELWASDTDEAAERARQRMELTLLDLKQAGRRVRGQVGDTEPNQALMDALAEFPADEILISTLPPATSNWLERGVVERAREEIDLPIRHLVWEPEAASKAAGLESGNP